MFTNQQIEDEYNILVADNTTKQAAVDAAETAHSTASIAATKSADALASYVDYLEKTYPPESLEFLP